ncbi:MAG: DUF2110 family protein [Candidatus Bathyarchaeota archaeon]|nr:DUF2110 family protein [Candidatus Bathyarchaeota archaeon]
MTTLTLLTKAPRGHQLKEIDDFLQTTFEELDVQAKIVGNAGGWVQVSVMGEDEEFAKNFIAKEIGLAPTTIENVQVGMELKGLIKKNSNPSFLAVDVGVIEPKIFQAKVSLRHLREVLMEEKPVELPKIAELWGLREGLPITIKVMGINLDEGVLEAELSTGQIDKLTLWRDSLLDRLIVLGASKSRVLEVLERTRLNRDVVDVESLGLFDQVLTCKLGTDAAGVISRVGGYLKTAGFVVFNARKIRDFLS